MRLLLINPNTNQATTATMQRIAQAAAPAGVVIEAATVTHGAALLTNEALLAMGAVATEALVASTDLSPYAGIIIAAFGDPGLDACRALAPIPVTGIAEAAMEEAAAFGRFAIATTTTDLVEAIARRLIAYGHADRFAGTWLTPGDAAALMADPARLEAVLGQVVAEGIAASAPDAVIIGGGPLAAVAERLRPRFTVPLVEPVPAAVRLAVSRAR